jgi:hypothetical protein
VGRKIVVPVTWTYGREIVLPRSRHVRLLLGFI